MLMQPFALAATLAFAGAGMFPIAVLDDVPLAPEAAHARVVAGAARRPRPSPSPVADADAAAAGFAALPAPLATTTAVAPTLLRAVVAVDPTVAATPTASPVPTASPAPTAAPEPTTSPGPEPVATPTAAPRARRTAAAQAAVEPGALAAPDASIPMPVAADVAAPAMPTVAPIAPTPAAAALMAPDGSLQYPFARKPDPVLTCRPLYVCDIALQSGETVLNLAIGDSLRWVIAAAQSGPGGATPHVFVKPVERNLNTNLVITTTKRVYYVALSSALTAVSPRISFSYPDDAAAAAAAREATERARQDDAASELPLLPPDKLDYNYRISGASIISPQRVYNDGVHSFIEFVALPNDLPVVFAVAPDGSNQIVNFRLRGTTFIVDGTASGYDLVLNAGTGKHGRGEIRSYVRHK